MTAARILELVATTTDERDPLGEITAQPEGFEPIDVDPNAISDLEFRLKVSNRLLAVERLQAEDRRAINRITTRFAVEGRPIPSGDVA